MFDAFKVHVATQFALGVAVHAHVDHHRAGFDHVGGQDIDLADGSHNHVGLQGHGLEVFGAAVANGDRGIFLQQHQRHGFAHNVAATNDHGVFAFEVKANALQHLHAAIRGAGPEARATHHEGAGAVDVKAVHVFAGRYGFNHFLRVNVRRQRQLHQDAVNAGVGVQGVYARQQVVFAHAGGVLLQHRVQASVRAGLDLVAYVNLRGLVVSHQYHRQPWGDALLFQEAGAMGNIGTNFTRQGDTVNQLGRRRVGHREQKIFRIC